MKETNSPPAYLYHYTSIEKLALILKNQTIRLNPLDTMDDLQEAQTADLNNIGKFVFVSSWTAETVESIPMWKMYTDPTAGVRIKLHSNPFVRHGTFGKDIERVTNIEASDEKQRNMRVDTFLDISDLIQKKFFSPEAWQGDILYPITYTSDPNLLLPSIVGNSGDGAQIHWGILGKYKNTGWHFQNEWRYIMKFISLAIDDIENLHANTVNTFHRILKGSEPPPFRYFDLKIAPEHFTSMEITISPQISLGNRILLEALVEKYNPSAVIIESEYRGLL